MLSQFFKRWFARKPAAESAEQQAARQSFDAQWYLASYPDVAAAGVDPWLHYWQHGRFEGRLPQQNHAVAWEHALWRGAEAVMLPRLQRLLNDATASADEAGAARVALARWFRWQEQWAQVVALLMPNGVLANPPQQGQAQQRERLHTLLLLIESYCRLVDDAAVPSVLSQLNHVVETLEAEFPDSPDTILARANVKLVQHGHSCTERLEHLSRLFSVHRLSLLALHDSSEPLSIDNLSTVAKPVDADELQSEPLVSVIVPLFNARASIDSALRCLFGQRGVRLEILVVDDASQDDSVACVQRWIPRCPPHITLQLLQHEVNQGAYAARNTGAAHARGDYITVHDSDDWSHPDKLRLQVAALEQHPHVKASLSDWVRATPALLFHRWRLDEYGWVYPNISSLMVRREVLDTLGYWDDVKVNADTEYRERIVAAYGESAVQQVLPGTPLAIGRASAESLSQRSESHLVSQFTGVRYHYMAAARRWHQSASIPAALYMPRYPQQRSFYAPGAMLREGKQNASPLALEDQLRASGLFDAGWYLTRYIDLQQAMVDPFEHFCKAGSAEGRDPGPGFSTSGYRRRYADELAQTGLAPWEHYLLHSAALPGQLARQEALPEWKGLPVLAGRPTVMVCAHQLGPQLFGAERSLLDVLEAMQALNWNTVVVIPEAGNVDYEAELLARCCILAVVPYGWWQVGKVPVEPCVAHLQAIIERYSVQAVHANTLVLDEPLVAAKRAGVPAVVHVRELPAHDTALCSALGATAEELRARVHHCSDVVIANSQTVARAFNGEALKDASPIYVVPNTIHMAPLLALPTPQPSPVFTVGMLSSNLPKKGLEDIEAVAKRLEGGVNVQFRLYGPETPAINALMERVSKGLAPSSLLHAGYVEHPAQALAEVDLVVNLSRFQESFGRTVLEAMAAARPVIAYAWGALPELVVEGETGYLIPLGGSRRVDEQAADQPVETAIEHMVEEVFGEVAEKIALLARSPDTVAQLGQAGRQRAAMCFSAESLAVALQNAYQPLLLNSGNKTI